MSGFYRFAKTVCNIAFSFWFRITIVGMENLPQDGGFIIVANHRTYVDPVLLGIRLKRQLYFMAKDELFRGRLMGPIVRGLGAFPVSRGKGDTSAIDKSVEVIKNGDILALFPEGTRSKTGELMQFKSGATVVAAQTDADIVPAAVYMSNSTRFRSRMVVSYGKPIHSSELGVDAANRRTIRAASKQLQGSVQALLDQSKEQCS